MNRDKILEEIEAIQDNADNVGFKGQNEHDLFIREELTDFFRDFLTIKIRKTFFAK